MSTFEGIPKMMRAAAVYRYGKIKVENKAVPLPKGKKVLVKVAAASLNSADIRFITADPFFLRLKLGLFSARGFTPGCDLAGKVVAIGEDVTRFEVGDLVFGNILERGEGVKSLAEYCCGLETSLEKIPNGISFKEAAAFPLGAQTAVVAMRDCVKEGDKVLITGSSGSVGCFAIQVAKAYGAHVTAVCSTSKVDFVKSLNPDKVIDYKKEDYFLTGETYDVIVDIAAYHSLYKGRDTLKPNGSYRLVGGSIRKLLGSMMFKSKLQSHGKSFEVVSLDYDTTGMSEVRRLVEERKIHAPVDREYTLEQVSEAVKRMVRREVLGKVIIDISTEV